MEGKDWAIVIATLVGPILAVQAQKWIERFRDKRERRLRIFRTLMSTRAERVSRDHVQALNQIDIEFYGRRIFGTKFQSASEKAVTNAWKVYNDHLNDKTFPTYEAWFRHGDGLFSKLLYEMSRALGYDFDEVQLKRDAYRPTAHVDLENAQIGVLKGMAGVLAGEKSFPVRIVEGDGGGDAGVAQGGATEVELPQRK